MCDDNAWMAQAMSQAKLAASNQEVPVGAVVVYQNKVIGVGANQMIKANDPTAHAEIIAIRDACKTLNNYRLPGCQLYTTLEPCLMCMGTIIHARIQSVIIATDDPRTGACGSAFSLHQSEKLNHRVEVIYGPYQDESAALLKSFFKARR